MTIQRKITANFQRTILKSPKGFTLIELLIFITILALMFLVSALFAPTYLKKARDARRKADLEKIKVALYDYYFDSDCFPTALPACNERFGASSTVYLNEFPCDPNGGSYGYQIEEAACSQWFKILTNLENTQDTDIDKVGCRHGCGPDCGYNYGLASTNIKVNKDCVIYYACGPSGECGPFDDPACSLCPKVFENDPTCGGGCDCSGPKKKENCCHDERGKHIPEDHTCIPAEEEED